MLGSPSAPVTLVEYGNLQCPICRAFAVDTLPMIIRDYVRDAVTSVLAVATAARFLREFRNNRPEMSATSFRAGPDGERARLDETAQKGSSLTSGSTGRKERNDAQVL